MEKRKTEVHLTTGEFARLCKVNKRTLFHYDEIDLLKPAFTSENGYRYYSHRQLDMFVIIHILKELKMPLKDIRDYLDHRTTAHMIDMAEKEINHIEQEIANLKHIQHVLQETISYAVEGQEVKQGEIRLEDHAEEKLICSDIISEGNQRNHYLEWTNNFREFNHFTQSMASSFVGTMIATRNLLSEENQAAYFFVKTNSDSTEFNTFIKPKGKYAVGYHHGEYETLNKTYARMMHFIEQNGLIPGEYAYEEYLIDEIAVKNPADYVTRITIGVLAN